MFSFPLIALACALAAPPAGEPWTLHVIDNASNGADGVRFADFNGDGLPDIATAWEEGGSIRVYQNPGPADARNPWPAVEVGRVLSPEDAVMADLDGDGSLDVVSCSEGNERKIWVHWAPHNLAEFMDSSAWTTTSLPAAEGKTQWMFSLPLDIDGANGIDIVAGAKNDGAAIGWLEAPSNARDVTGWQWHPLREAGWIMSLIPFDVDNDGQTDVVYTDRRQARRGAGWLENPGTANPAALRAPWEDHILGGRDAEVMFLAQGAFSPAGATDWLCASRGTGLFRFTHSGNPAVWQEQEISMPEGTGTGKGVAIGDLNGDSQADIAVTCENAGGVHGAFWLEQTDAGWVAHTISGIPGTKYDRIELYDFDQDGDLDLLTCEERENLGVIWYENPLH